MSAETQLYATLSAHAGLTALVGTRIYPDAIPENSALPAVVYIRANTVPTYSIGGVLLCEEVRLALSGWSKTRAEAEAVADQVQAALQASGNPITDRNSGFDNEVGLYAVTIDVEWFIA